jgi:hypothetical protein
MKFLALLFLIPTAALAQYQMTVHTQITTPEIVLQTNANPSLKVVLKSGINGQFLITGFATKAQCEAYDPTADFQGVTFDLLPVTIVIASTYCSKS